MRGCSWWGLASVPEPEPKPDSWACTDACRGVQEEYERVMSSPEETGRVEIRLMTRDGDQRWARLQLLRSFQGLWSEPREVHVLVSVEDITASKLHLPKFCEHLEHLPLGAILLQPGGEVYANAALLTLLGCDKEDVQSLDEYMVDAGGAAEAFRNWHQGASQAITATVPFIVRGVVDEKIHMFQS